MNHVNPKTLVGLGVATLVAIAAGAVITQRQKPASEAATPIAAPYVMPGLRDHLNDVGTITLTGANDKVLTTIEKGTDGWQVKEKNYPADAAKVRELLLKLADATLIEQKTANQHRYTELGVEAVKAPDAKGVLVALSGHMQPQQLIVGNVNSRHGAGTFVRRPGETQSWLAKGSLSIDKITANWLDKAVIDIPAAQLKEVSLVQPDGRRLKFGKAQPTDANFAIADVPKGRELSSDFATNGIASMLAGLQFEDVLTTSEVVPPADGKMIEGRYVSFDGIVVAVEGWKLGERHFARFDVSFDRAVAEVSIVADQAKAAANWHAPQAQKTENEPADGTAKPDTASAPPPGVVDPAADREQRMASADKIAVALHARLGGRVFVLPAYKFANLEKTIDDVLKPIEAKKPAVKTK